MKRLLALLVLLGLPMMAADITFTKRYTQGAGTTPVWIWWFNAVYDPVSHRTIWPLAPTGYGGIYSTHWLWWNDSSHSFYDFGGSSSTTDSCPTGMTIPRDRHPDSNVWVDTNRNRLFVWTGVNVSCADNPLLDLYYMNLNSDPSTNSWTRVIPAHFPDTNGYGTTAYDANVDAYVNIALSGGGQARLWIYCPSAGSTTSKQNAAGCGTTANDWIQITDYTGTYPNVGGTPIGNYYNSAYDPVTKKVYTYGGTDGALANYNNNMFTYDTENKVFAQVCTGTCQSSGPPVYNGGVADIGALTAGPPGTLFYAQSRNTGAFKIWRYNTVGQSWTAMTQTGFTNNTYEGVIAYNASTNTIDLWIKNPDTTNAEFWEGQLASHSTTLTVQESIFTGGPTSGIARTNEPFSVGVALPDSWGVTSTSVLGLSGASDAQFRLMGTWPGSGNYKWVKATGTLSSLSAGGTASVSFDTNGAGNTGANIATDNGSTITIATGTATFTIKKANYNGLDVVDVGSTHIILTNASNGFVAYGPNPSTYPGNVTCSPTSGGTDCSVATGTKYMSKYDNGSTCSIIENGPVMAQIKCTWTYKTSGGSSSYFKGTSYSTFYKNKNYATIRPVDRNADYGTAGGFAASFKQVQGVELQLALNTSGTQNVTIGNHTGTPTTASVSGSDDVYLYQGASTVQQFENNSVVYPYTTDSGYVIRKNGGTSGLTGTTSGTSAQSPAGWADIDSSGVGVQIGVDWLGPRGSKSLEFAAGGPDVRIGILAPQNTTRPYTLEWPAWIHEGDIFLNFHASAPSSLSNDFLKWQTFLLARQSVDDYNTAGVFLSPLVSSTVQDTAESTAASIANPALSSGAKWAVGNATNATDTGIPGTNPCPNIVRNFAWDLENDFRYDYMMTWIQRGWACRYLQAANFYDFQAQYAWPHSDGFNWYDHWDASFTEVDGNDLPRACASQACANMSMGLHGTLGGSHSYDNHNWRDAEHGHLWGHIDFYHLSGDQYHLDALMDLKDWYLAEQTYQNGGNTASSTVTTVSGNSTVTLTCCASWTAKAIGQNLLVGSSGLKTVYKIISLTDGTHAVVSPTPTANATNALVTWGVGFGNSRSYATSTLTGIKFYTLLSEIGDTDAPAVANQLKNLFAAQILSEPCSAGYPAGCDYGTYNDYATWGTQGVDRKRGFHWGPGGGSGTWCGINPTTYRVNSAFQSALVSEALIALAKTFGTSWTDYWTALDLSYGISQFALSELWASDASGTWTGEGFRFGFAPDVKNSCDDPARNDVWTVSSNGSSTVTRLTGTKSFANIAMVNTVALPPNGTMGLVIINGTRYIGSTAADADHLTLTTTVPTNASQNMIIQEADFQTQFTTNVVTHLFYAKWLVDGVNDTTKYNIDLAGHMGISGTAYRDWMGHNEISAIYAATNNTKSLQTLTISSFTESPAGTYNLGWTTPANTDYLRVKYAPSHTGLVDWIGFNPSTNAFTGTATNTAWFAAKNATGIPAAATGSQSMSITTGVSGMDASDFSVKAYTLTSCGVTPTAAGPYTATQSVSSPTFSANAQCAASSYGSTGLSGSGLSVNSSTGQLTGTAVAGTYSATITYDTASQPMTIIINPATAISTGATLPAGTQGVAYNQTLSVGSTGTAPITWDVTSGSVPAGTNLSAGGVLSGTPTTATGYSFTARATDYNGITDSRTFSVTINASGGGGGRGQAPHGRSPSKGRIVIR